MRKRNKFSFPAVLCAAGLLLSGSPDGCLRKPFQRQATPTGKGDRLFTANSYGNSKTASVLFDTINDLEAFTSWILLKSIMRISAFQPSDHYGVGTSLSPGIPLLSGWDGQLMVGTARRNNSSPKCSFQFNMTFRKLAFT